MTETIQIPVNQSVRKLPRNKNREILKKLLIVKLQDSLFRNPQSKRKIGRYTEIKYSNKTNKKENQRQS